jgi:hypothetical protein
MKLWARARARPRSPRSTRTPARGALSRARRTSRIRRTATAREELGGECRRSIPGTDERHRAAGRNWLCMRRFRRRKRKRRPVPAERTRFLQATPERDQKGGEGCGRCRRANSALPSVRRHSRPGDMRKVGDVSPPPSRGRAGRAARHGRWGSLDGRGDYALPSPQQREGIARGLATATFLKVTIREKDLDTGRRPS